MDSEGVAMQVLFANSGNILLLPHRRPAPRELAAAQNEFFARITPRAPNTLRCVGGPSPCRTPTELLMRCARCMGYRGFFGVEIGTRVGRYRVGRPQPWTGFFAVAHEPRRLGLGSSVGPGPTTTGSWKWEWALVPGCRSRRRWQPQH